MRRLRIAAMVAGLLTSVVAWLDWWFVTSLTGAVGGEVEPFRFGPRAFLIGAIGASLTVRYPVVAAALLAVAGGLSLVAAANDYESHLFYATVYLALTVLTLLQRADPHGHGTPLQGPIGVSIGWIVCGMVRTTTPKRSARGWR